MAISGFGRGKSGTSARNSTVTASVGASSSGSSSSSGLGNLTAFIDQGSEFDGKLSFKDTVRIDGLFSGEISSDNTLIVGETGEIHAKIDSVCVVISGLVEGDIHAKDQVVLHKTAVVNGDIHSPSFIVEEGAQLNGAVRMTPSSAKPNLAPVNSGESGNSGDSKRASDHNGKSKSH